MKLNMKFLYSLVIVIVLVYVLKKLREGFAVPVFPSPEQDQKLVTPAGNVITY